ncbi:MAG TPA: fluoride efflux transporter CrcB [Micromonosporaceae bacterium]
MAETTTEHHVPTDLSPDVAPRADHHLPADSDVDLHDPGQRHELDRAPWTVLGAIAVGGALGAVARYAVGTAVHAAPTGFPWATYGVNVSGCLLIGVLMVLITEVVAGHRLVRPFLGVGVLGGFTTFSTYVVDIQRLVNAGAAGTALGYLVATVLSALLAVYLGVRVTRAAMTALTSLSARDAEGQSS